MKKAIYLAIAALALLLAFLAGCAVTIRCAVPVGPVQNTNGYITYNKNHLERGGFYYFSFLNKIVSQE